MARADEHDQSIDGELSDSALGDIAGGGPTDIAHWNYCACGYACLDAAAFTAHRRTCTGGSSFGG